MENFKELIHGSALKAVYPNIQYYEGLGIN